ncbi:MAG: hypothetical protein A2234_06110 [Elusimicrobia bacterium RIFOXYA2_FULL_58_8]|nr:MAG: hypothetical protein A2285_00215 [Elusimicrobia bacterium RIFOXYA12_FULL_57_11]OGS17031.1 MAG: hypothetical protein A2234_06110 [Elusimicrobia bacterium RIFOXYA2_FULL_58_8]
MAKTNIGLVFCPGWSIDAPPLALATLAAYVRGQTRHTAACFDLNSRFYRAAGRFQTYWDNLRLSILFWLDEGSVERFIRENGNLVEGCVREILASPCRVLGFSVCNSQALFALALARRIKAADPSRIIIFGGPECDRHISGPAFARESAVDGVVMGEGEAVLGPLLDGVSETGLLPAIPGLLLNLGGGRIQDCGPAAPCRDLDQLPFADYSDFSAQWAAGEYRAAGDLWLFTSRGCLGHCHFCQQCLLCGGFRTKSAERIFAEIKHLAQQLPGIKKIFFSDLLINGDLQVLERLCDLLLAARLQLKWGGHAVVSPRMSEALLRKMAAAGCSFLWLGLESGSERVRRLMNKNPFTNDEAAGFLQRGARAGIELQGNFMFGMPGETRGDFSETLAFLTRVKPWLHSVAESNRLCAIYPETYLYSHAGDLGILHADSILFWEMADGSNGYLERLRRSEEFTRLARSLGIPSCSRGLPFPKWLYLGDYFSFKGDRRLAGLCYRRSRRYESLPELADRKLAGLSGAGPAPGSLPGHGK